MTLTSGLWKRLLLCAPEIFPESTWEELINEVGSIAGGLRRELAAILRDILEALLILTYAGSDQADAERQLVHAQGQLQLLLYSAPTLREVIQEILEKEYRRAKDNVTEDYGLRLPESCPFPLERIVEDPFDRLVAEGKLA
jgi:hypothetical protein